MNLNKRLNNIIASTSEKRIDFTISRFCDSGEIWVLQSNNNGKLIQCVDENGNFFLPIFPELEIIELYQTDEWTDTVPLSFEIGEFFYELIPFLIENDVNVSVFPNLKLNELNAHQPKELALKLQIILNESYDEFYELSYL